MKTQTEITEIVCAKVSAFVEQQLHAGVDVSALIGALLVNMCSVAEMAGTTVGVLHHEVDKTWAALIAETFREPPCAARLLS